MSSYFNSLLSLIFQVTSVIILNVAVMHPILWDLFIVRCHLKILIYQLVVVHSELSTVAKIHKRKFNIRIDNFTVYLVNIYHRFSSERMLQDFKKVWDKCLMSTFLLFLHKNFCLFWQIIPLFNFNTNTAEESDVSFTFNSCKIIFRYDTVIIVLDN